MQRLPGQAKPRPLLPAGRKEGGAEGCHKPDKTATWALIYLTDGGTILSHTAGWVSAEGTVLVRVPLPGLPGRSQSLCRVSSEVPAGAKVPGEGDRWANVTLTETQLAAFHTAA